MDPGSLKARHFRDEHRLEIDMQPESESLDPLAIELAVGMVPPTILQQQLHPPPASFGAGEFHAEPTGEIGVPTVCLLLSDIHGNDGPE